MITRKEVTPKIRKLKKEESTSNFTSCIEKGLIEDRLTKEGEKKLIRIGNHLKAIAFINNHDGNGAGLLLEFQTGRGAVSTWKMDRGDLAGDGIKVIAELMARDYAFDRKQKQSLLDYLHGINTGLSKTYTIASSSGWIEDSFVLPHKTYGDQNLVFRDVVPSPDTITESIGTLKEWVFNVAAKCSGNSRLILGLGTSFAAPLLPLLGIESGGFHLTGTSSKGKTIILLVAASVTGLKSIPHWRATANGLEGMATAFNHLCLPLDEIGQADPREVGGIVYMLANEQGKARMTKRLIEQKPKAWRLMVLSSGEFGLGAYMAQANINQKGGQEVRLPDVPAVPDGSVYGCFESIHGAKTSEEFATALKSAANHYHGTALDLFLSKLLVDKADPTFIGILAKQVNVIAINLTGTSKDSTIGRVAKRFAVVQVSLELAHKYGLLPFPANHIDWAITSCFHGWFHLRGGDGSIEIKQAIKRIEHLLTINEFSDRMYDLRDGDSEKVRNLLGYRKVDVEGNTSEFWIPPSVFDKEFCNGVNKDDLIKELQRTGLLLPPRSDGKPILQRKIRSKRAYYYVFASLYPNIRESGEFSES